VYQQGEARHEKPTVLLAIRDTKKGNKILVFTRDKKI